MRVDQKANLKKMRELLFLMKEELENKPKQQADIKAAIDSALPQKDEKKLKAELVELINKNQVTYSDLERIDILTSTLRKPLRDMAVSNFEKYRKEFEKLCHHKYELSTEYAKAAGEAGSSYVSPSLLEKAKKDAIRDLKYFADQDFADKCINALFWIVREDGLYGPEYWHRYDEIGLYNGLDR